MVLELPELHVDLEHLVTAPRIKVICEATENGAAIFELFEIQRKSDVLKYVRLFKRTPQGSKPWKTVSSAEELWKTQSTPSISKRNIVGLLSEILEYVRKHQANVRISTDPSIRKELHDIDRKTHSWYKLVARPDADRASPPNYPKKNHPWYVYKLFSEMVKTHGISSVTLFFDEDIGLVKIACNELIFNPARRIRKSTSLSDSPVKLGEHPDHVCWNEDDEKMYQFPGWPDWADTATWFDNFPLESDFLVMSMIRGDEHRGLMKRSPRHANSTLVMLFDLRTTPRCELSSRYQWYWHRGNIFIGIARDASIAAKHHTSEIARIFDMESVKCTFNHP